MTILLFILLLVVSFLVLLYFLRPTATETAVQQHLESIEENRAVESDSTSILRRQVLSATPWLDELLRDLPGSADLARLIRQAGQTWQVSSFLLLSLVVTVIVTSLASLAIPMVVVSLLLGIAAGSLPYVFLLIARERRFRKCDAQVPEAVDLMARALRAGHAVPAVIEMVGREIAEPLAGEFRIVHEEQNLGLPLRDAMLNLVDRVPRDDVRFVVTAILLQKETGGNLAEILDTIGESIRQRFQFRSEVLPSWRSRRSNGASAPVSSARSVGTAKSTDTAPDAISSPVKSWRTCGMPLASGKCDSCFSHRERRRRPFAKTSIPSTASRASRGLPQVPRTVIR